MAAAIACGHSASLFRDAREVTGPGVAFCRIEQDPARIEAGRSAAEELSGRGLAMVPDIRMIRQYENKWMQTEAFGEWMPRTLLLDNAGDAYEAIDALQFPFISKSKAGSAAKNIRVIASREAAEREISQAFGQGIPAWGGGQSGYLIWQELCEGNDYDYRVNVVGRELAIARRWNKPGTVFASGHGQIDNVDPSDAETSEVLDFAMAFFAAQDMSFAAIDIVRGRDGWKVLEASLAWPAHQKPWQARRFISGRFCADMFDVVVEEIEAGVFWSKVAA